MPAGPYQALDVSNVIGLFQTLYEPAVDSLWSRQSAMDITSNTETQNLGVLGAAPKLESLVGGVASEEGFNAYTYLLTNQEYAKTIPIKARDLSRDRTGLLQVRIGEFVTAAAQHWDDLTVSAITANGAGYDGVSFFGATHPESGTVQINDLAAAQVSALNVTTAASPTPDEMASILPKVIGKMLSFTDDKGRAVNGGARQFNVICPTADIWASALHAVSADRLSSGQTNQVRGLQSKGYTITPVLEPQLAALTTNFWVLRADGAVKPFVHQEEVPLEPAVSTEANERYINRREFLFNLYASRAVGYGRWQSAARCTLS